VPDDAAAAAAMDRAWQRLSGGQHGAAQEIVSKGRVISVPRAAKGVARFSFADLCERPLGAVDYLKLAHEFHTLLIDHVPVMDFSRRNEAKRFITLIDTLYDQAVKLVASAQAEPDALYSAHDGAEAMEFKRTASRLIEMRSDSYLGLPHGRRDSPGQLREGIVET
jgi:cell division protein ZapE